MISAHTSKALIYPTLVVTVYAPAFGFGGFTIQNIGYMIVWPVNNNVGRLMIKKSRIKVVVVTSRFRLILDGAADLQLTRRES
jgi:uncharacterized membrane protein